MQRTALALLWPAPVLVLPLVLDLTGRSGAVQEWLLSIDVPLAWLLALQAGLSMVSLASRPDSERWIAPQWQRGTAGRLLKCTRLLGAVRWPLGFALATELLSLGDTDFAGQTRELLVLAAIALFTGASLAWLLINRSATTRDPVGSAAPTVHVWLALSMIPLRETQRILDVRRLSLLAVPILLAAPMGTPAQQVLRAVAAWVPMLFFANWIGQAARITQALTTWLPRARRRPAKLYWRIWRVVLLATVLGAAALWLGWRATERPAGASTP